MIFEKANVLDVICAQMPDPPDPPNGPPVMPPPGSQPGGE